ncbi:MAG: ABC transporter substrate-binding protein [Fuerstiella sp.]
MSQMLKSSGNALQLFAFCCLLLSNTGCGTSGPADKSADSTDDVQRVTLALNWYAEAEHGGYVAGVKLGYFGESGLDVDIQQGGPGAPNLVIQELAAGRIQFAISSADMVILARSKGVPIVAVAAPLQNSPRCIMVHKAAGMNSLHDLANVELAISDSRPFALWMKKKLPLTGVTMVPFNGLVGEFLQKPNFAQQAYVFSEPFVAQENGGDPQTLMLSDIGFNPYSSLLVTTEDVIRNDPTLVKKMVEASVKGWTAYLDSPDEVNESIHADNEEMSLASLKFGVETMKPLCQPENGTPLCGMQPERWATLIQQIEELGEIETGAVVAAKCFDTSFLPSGTVQGLRP